MTPAQRTPKVLDYLRTVQRPQTSAQIAIAVLGVNNGRLVAGSLRRLRHDGLVQSLQPTPYSVNHWSAAPIDGQYDEVVELARRLVIAVCERVIEKLNR
jgi:hypothetical protein